LNKLIHYFPDLTKSQISQYENLIDLYKYWNSKINLISRKDINEIETRHLIHSLSISKIFSFNDNSNILDVGTGGGFPGIPLAIMFPNVNFHLTDSIGKKIKVVNAIIRDLDLKNVYAEQIRSENVTKKYDFIVNRAVTNMTNLFSLIGNKFSKTNNHSSFKNGIISLKGGDLKNELSSFHNAEIFELNNFFREIFFETKKIVYVPNPYMGMDNQQED
jgi:16S rRNA (guanine527-N7)-methyltransferase